MRHNRHILLEHRRIKNHFHPVDSKAFVELGHPVPIVHNKERLVLLENVDNYLEIVQIPDRIEYFTFFRAKLRRKLKSKFELLM